MVPRSAEHQDLEPSAALLMRAGIAGWDAAALADSAARSDRRVMVSGPKGAPTGVAVAGWVLDEGELFAVAVDEAVRRRGLGRALVESVMRAAEEAGVARMHLEVRSRNGGAIALYRALSFEEVGRRARFYGDEDAVLMTWAAPPRALEDVTLIVLAGGEGRRLGGVVKPLMRRANDETLVERVATALGPSVKAMLLVAPRHLHPALAKAWSHPIVEDAQQGPALALGAAARQVETAWLAAVAADLVDPDAALLLALAKRRSEAVDAVVPVADGFDQFLFGMYRTAALLGEEGPRSMKAWVKRLRTVRVPVERTAGLKDVDTPEDVASFGLKAPR